MSNKLSEAGYSLLLELSSRPFDKINFLNFTSKSIGEVIDFYRNKSSLSEKQDNDLSLIIEKLSDVYNDRINSLEFNGYSLDDEWAFLAELKGQRIPELLIGSIHRRQLDADSKWNLLKEYIKNEKRETASLFQEQRISAAEKETWLKVWKKIENKIECLDSVGVRIIDPKDFNYSMRQEDL